MANTVIVDSLKLVQERRRLAGVLAVADLPRLVESLHGSDGSLDYAIRGDKDGRERPLLRLQVSGLVQLQCQRCMETLAHALSIDTALRLVAAESLDAEYEASGADPDEPDCIAASKELDVVALIEDEVLLALPPYPRHDDGVCKAKVGEVLEAEVAAKAKITAFSALNVLKSTAS